MNIFNIKMMLLRSGIGINIFSLIVSHKKIIVKLLSYLGFSIFNIKFGSFPINFSSNSRIIFQNDKGRFSNHTYQTNDVSKRFYEEFINYVPIQQKLIVEKGGGIYDKSMIFDEKFRISGDNVNLLDDLYHLPSSYDFLPKRFDILDQEIGVCTGCGTFGNYHHWMMFGMLPKIYILKKYYGNDFVPYIDDQLLFHKEAIDHIGIKNNYISSSNTFIRAGRVIGTNSPCDTGVVPSWLYDYLREVYSYVPRSTYKRIFLNRTASRRIENFDQIRSILEKYEFQIVDDDDERIIEYCKGAEIIVGIHGGAMTNILFSDPGTRVLELFPSDFIHNHYFNTSMTSGLRYDCLVCESTSAILSRTSNLIVDLNLFLESLNKIVHY